ncbi:MAG: RNA polymerase sigma factor [Candidatus Aminicenantes bacterium]|jgi:RNA polymerase sigma-70 factor (ECF subfamily)
MEPDSREDRMNSERIIQEEFDDLYEQYRPAVYSFACYLTQNSGEAEDLFQETWLRVVHYLPKKVEKSSAKAWIFTITANLHKDALRKKRIRRAFLFQKVSRSGPDEDAPSFLFGSIPAEANGANRSDMRRDIERAMKQLPEQQRGIFALREIEGLKYSEISEIYGIPLGTVKSLMFRAVRRLRRELSAYSPKREKVKCNVKTLSV